MHFYLYQITNLINGKIYVGVHKTKSLDDGYMGSGKVIQRTVINVVARFCYSEIVCCFRRRSLTDSLRFE